MSTLKNMMPTGKKIFILPSNVEQKTKSGIIVPDVVQDVAVEGVVVAIDPTVRQVKMGDTVIFQKGTGASLDIDRVNHLMFREHDKDLHAVKNIVTGEIKLL